MAIGDIKQLLFHFTTGRESTSWRIGADQSALHEIYDEMTRGLEDTGSGGTLTETDGKWTEMRQRNPTLYFPAPADGDR